MASNKSPDLQLETAAPCDSPRVNNKTINTKNCGQCDAVLKRNQRSMNCYTCKYWFCLDCSHITGKLYDLLRSECTSNLPFNCDGCMRILPKLTELVARIDDQKRKFEEYDGKIEQL